MRKEKPVHKILNSGYFEPHIDTYCKLGDSYDKGFERGAEDWDKVTCKRCLKQKGK